MMNANAICYVYDRPTPVYSCVTAMTPSYVYDRPTPVYSLVTSLTSAYTYDRKTPIITSVSTAVAETYDSVTTVNPTQLKRWDGTQWIRSPYYVWNGTAWVQVT